MCCVLDVREVFDLFDFWDGRDGLVDGAKVGDLLRCCSLNPTNKLVFDNGGTKKLGNDYTKTAGCAAASCLINITA